MSYIDENIPKLGFGLMRLPMNGKNIDIEETKKMVDLFIDKGFTYFDTAYGYNDGESEIAAKAALVDRYPRESFQLATKCPAYLAKDRAGALEMFNTSLKRTGAGYFDFYLLHNLGVERTQPFYDMDIFGLFEEQKKKGLIKHLGFSIHDNAEALDKVLTDHPEMEFVQLQINYADWESQNVESRKCYEVARKHNKPIVIMEPVKGGNLANLPGELNDVFKKANPDASVSSWALRYALSLDGLVTVLSGMSSLDQMKDNLNTMENFRPLDEDELKLVEKVRKELESTPHVPCTGCSYCVKDCPQHIIIPDVFDAMNNYLVYDNMEMAKGSYEWAEREGSKASDCICCGACERVCPQQIKITEELTRAAELFE